MIEQTVEIPTRDGVTTTFISHSERDGPHPLVPFYMDAPAIREELRDMARPRLASAGYYVMLPNLYRAGVMELGPPAGPDSPELKRMFELMTSLTIDLVMSDTEALLAYAKADPAASTVRRAAWAIVHERPVRRERGGAPSRAYRGGGVDLRHVAGHRPA